MTNENRNFNSINDANNSNALVIYQLADYEAGSTANYGIITDSLEYAKQEANQLATDGDISILEYKRESTDNEFEDSEEIWSTKEDKTLDYITYEFTNRDELESWIDSHADLDEESYYWGWIENFKTCYSLNDLKDDISDDWFEDPNGDKLTVTIYEMY